MDRIFDFVVAIMFYGFIEGIICYLAIQFANKEFNNKFVDIVKNGFIVGVGLSICSGFIQILGVSQICMALVLGGLTIFRRIKIEKLNVSFKMACIYIVQSFVIVTIIILIEFTMVNLINNIGGIHIFNLYLTDVSRFLTYVILKFIDFLVLFIYRGVIMKRDKMFVGGTKPRGQK